MEWATRGDEVVSRQIHNLVEEELRQKVKYAARQIKELVLAQLAAPAVRHEDQRVLAFPWILFAVMGFDSLDARCQVH